jgi:hypothetical protein
MLPKDIEASICLLPGVIVGFDLVRVLVLCLNHTIVLAYERHQKA